MTHPGGLDPEIVLMGRGRTWEISLHPPLGSLLGVGETETSMSLLWDWRVSNPFLVFRVIDATVYVV